MTWYLRNTWYAAAFEAELDGDFLTRTICDVPLVIFRRGDGSLAAIHDRCPHRFVPLSMGKRVGDTIQCGYHGLRFAGDGSCAELPFDDGSARTDVCVEAFPVVSRDTIAWIWMGDPDRADPGLIPDFWPLRDPEMRTSRGVSRFDCNYQILSDNLLDLSHLDYLHPGVHGSSFATFRNEVKVEGDTVWSMLDRPGYALDDKKREDWGLTGETCDGQGHSRWSVPGVLLVETAFWQRGTQGRGHVAHGPSTHLLTPETEFTTHYIWASSRNFGPNTPEAIQAHADWLRTIFETQDGPMAEAQQRAMGRETDLLKLRPAILRADKAGVVARRVLQRRIRAENGDTAATDAEQLVDQPLG